MRCHRYTVHECDRRKPQSLGTGRYSDKMLLKGATNTNNSTRTLTLAQTLTLTITLTLRLTLALALTRCITHLEMSD